MARRRYRNAGPAKSYGVFPHAEWRWVSRDEGKIYVTAGGGYVVRELPPGVPYSHMVPVKVFKSRAAADKLADKLSGY